MPRASDTRTWASCRAAAGALLLGGALSCSSTASPTGPPHPSTLDGAALYARYCKLCHAPAGEGYASDNANALANQGFLSTASDRFLFLAIENGRPGTPMSAFGQSQGGPLDRPAMLRLVAHLRSWQKAPKLDVEGQQVAGDARAGAEVYGERCAACHGEHGGGKTAMSLNNPVFLMTASDGFIRQAIEHGREGTAMPAFGGDLAPQQIDDLTALVRSWTRNVDDQPVGELPPSFERVVVHPDGPPPSFPALREGRYLPAASVAKALQAGSRLVLLDARPTSDWLRSHIPGALPVPYYDGIRSIIEALPRDGTWIIAYCGCPHAASGSVMDQLRAAGFANTAVIDEGFFVWTSRGYPLTHGSRPTSKPPEQTH